MGLYVIQKNDGTYPDYPGGTVRREHTPEERRQIAAALAEALSVFVDEVQS